MITTIIIVERLIIPEVRLNIVINTMIRKDPAVDAAKKSDWP